MATREQIRGAGRHGVLDDFLPEETGGEDGGLVQDAKDLFEDLTGIDLDGDDTDTDTDTDDVDLDGGDDEGPGLFGQKVVGDITVGHITAGVVTGLAAGLLLRFATRKSK